MTPLQAIRAATTVAAELIERRRPGPARGPGLLADVIAVPGDPLDRHHRHRAGALRDEGRHRLPRRRHGMSAGEPHRRGRTLGTTSTMTELEGKVAVITGAGSGMGRATAEVVVREGAMVLAAGISGQQGDTAAASDRATFITGAHDRHRRRQHLLLPS